MRAASVVVLPEPVGPDTITKPRGASAIVLKIGPRPKASIVLTLAGMVRNTAAAPRF